MVSSLLVGDKTLFNDRHQTGRPCLDGLSRFMALFFYSFACPQKLAMPVRTIVLQYHWLWLAGRFSAMYVETCNVLP